MQERRPAAIEKAARVSNRDRAGSTAMAIGAISRCEWSRAASRPRLSMACAAADTSASRAGRARRTFRASTQRGGVMAWKITGESRPVGRSSVLRFAACSSVPGRLGTGGAGLTCGGHAGWVLSARASAPSTNGGVLSRSDLAGCRRVIRLPPRVSDRHRMAETRRGSVSRVGAE